MTLRLQDWWRQHLRKQGKTCERIAYILDEEPWEVRKKILYSYSQPNFCVTNTNREGELLKNYAWTVRTSDVRPHFWEQTALDGITLYGTVKSTDKIFIGACDG